VLNNKDYLGHYSLKSNKNEKVFIVVVGLRICAQPFLCTSQDRHACLPDVQQHVGKTKTWYGEKI